MLFEYAIPKSLVRQLLIMVDHFIVNVAEALSITSKRAASVKGCFLLGRNLIIKTCRRSSNEAMDNVGSDLNQFLAFPS